MKRVSVDIKTATTDLQIFVRFSTYYSLTLSEAWILNLLFKRVLLALTEAGANQQLHSITFPNTTVLDRQMYTFQLIQYKPENACEHLRIFVIKKFTDLFCEHQVF